MYQNCIKTENITRSAQKAFKYVWIYVNDKTVLKVVMVIINQSCVGNFRTFNFNIFKPTFDKTHLISDR